MYRVWNLLEKNSQYLLIGAVTALVWANVSPGSYHALVDFPLFGDRPAVTLHYLINDVLMALFFAVAGKEVWEAIALRGGALRGRKAITPLIATAGGMLGPVAVYLSGAALLGQFEGLASGWAIPTATDIAFSYLVGRFIFGAGHPAVKFLLLLAIADDAGGLVILAVFYPQGNLSPEWLMLPLAATLATYFAFNRLPRGLDGDRPDRPVSTIVRQKLSFWPYLVAGILSWIGFQKAGIHPALSLLPIVVAIPHSDIEFGIFAKEEERQTDLLNWIEHRLKVPIQFVLLLFGFANAGVEFSVIAEATWLVFAGLIIGKPIGIFLFGWFAARLMGLGLPEGMRLKDLFVLGCVAAIGFTVSLFVASVAFPPGQVQDAAKMGALLSFAAAAIAIIAGKIAGVEHRDLPAPPYPSTATS